jgi:hypothetical protein
VSHSPKDIPEVLSGHEHRRFNSVAVIGADGHTSYEGTDAPARVVLISLGIVAALAAICFALMFGYDKYLESQHPRGELPSPLAAERIVPPAPQVERLPWLDLPEMHAHEQEVLNSSGKDKAGLMHVPIENAIDTVASSINTKPGEPQGITVPGGQGRAFSRSLADMPPAYQHSQSVIQGEIEKHAQ